MDIVSTTPVAAIRVPQSQIGLTWRAGIVVVAAAIAWLIFCFASTAASMVGTWARSETFMHGFLIAPISGWLIWRLRHRLVPIVPRPSYWALLPMVGAGMAWFVGELTNVNALSQFAFVALLVLAVPMTLGWTVARAITFPLAFLFFMVPLGEFLLPPLMEGTAFFAVEALRVTGVPVYREGLQFVIPSGKWSVVEACSGVRYLIASLVAGSLYAYLNYRSTRRRAVFCAISIAVPIVANWVRAYLIVLLGHLSNNTIAVGVDHLIYGWVFFGVVLFLLFWAGSFWREPEDLETSMAPATGVPAAMVGRGVGFALPAFGAFAIVVGIWPLANLAFDRANAAPPPVLASPGLPGSWIATGGSLADWAPQFIGASAQSHVTYSQRNAPVGMYVGYYRNQGDGRKLISSDNALVTSDNAKWQALGSVNVKSGVAAGPAEVRETLLKRTDGSRLVAWQWYWIDGQLTASDVVAKLYTLRARLAGRGDDGAVVIVTARADGLEDARATLKSFLSDAAPSIGAALQRSRDQR